MSCKIIYISNIFCITYLDCFLSEPDDRSVGSAPNGLVMFGTATVITGSVLLIIPAVAGTTACIARSERRICRNLMVMIVLRFTWFVSAKI